MSSPAPFNDARSRLEAANLGVAIAWPNETFRKPIAAPGANPPPWLSVDMTSNVLAPIELTGGAWQEQGVLYVDVMVATGTGSDVARTLAKDVANVFRDINEGDVIYEGGSIGNGVVSEPSGNWWTITVTVLWKYQDMTQG